MAARPRLQLFSSWFCPYAQRAWITLEELGLPYEWVEIQPYQLRQDGSATKNPKPLEQKRADYPGFVEASPKGLVPALAERDSAGTVRRRVHDSLVCVRYLDEVWGGGRLQSNNLEVQRGIAVAEGQVIPHFYRLLMEAGTEQRLVHSDAIFW